MAGRQKTAHGQETTIWGLPGQAVTETAPKPATAPNLSALDRIAQSITDLSDALEQLRRDLKRAA